MAEASSSTLSSPNEIKTKNVYGHMEWAGAFGDIGTLIPFIVAYITIVGVDPLGLLFMFGISKIVSGIYYKTPIPIQPMKAIGAAAIAGGISPTALYASGLTTGVFWMLIGLTGTINVIAKLATKPVVRGIMLGLGMAFIVEGVHRMVSTPLLAGIALVVTFALLNNPKIPAMFALLMIGIVAAFIMNPELVSEIANIHFNIRFPEFSLQHMSWDDVLTGTMLFTLPQIPLTLGNGIVAIVAENNELFPDRPVTEKKISISTGIMNLISPLFGGVPMCHGAGGMAGHVRFGAKTGGSLVILGCIVIFMAIFLSDSIALIFKVFPTSILGVILFFAGTELALSIRDIGTKKSDVYVMLTVAGFAMWHMGVAFLVGVALDTALRREWIRI